MKAKHPLALHVRFWRVVVCLFPCLAVLPAQGPAPPPVHAEVHFDQKLQDWDGFGVNYVEVCGVRDLVEYKKNPPNGCVTSSARG